MFPGWVTAYAMDLSSLMGFGGKEGNPDFVVRPFDVRKDSAEHFPTVEDLLIGRQKDTFPEKEADKA